MLHGVHLTMSGIRTHKQMNIKDAKVDMFIFTCYHWTSVIDV